MRLHPVEIVRDGPEASQQRRKVLEILEPVRVACEIGLSGELDPEEAADIAAGLLSMVTVQGTQRVADRLAASGGLTEILAQMVARGEITATYTDATGETFPVDFSLALPDGVTKIRDRKEPPT